METAYGDISSANTADHNASTASNWINVQRIRVQAQLAKLPTFQQAYFVDIDIQTHQLRTKQLESANAATLTLMKEYVGEVHQAMHLPGREDRSSQLFSVIQQYKALEIGFILKLRLNMEMEYRQVYPDTIDEDNSRLYEDFPSVISVSVTEAFNRIPFVDVPFQSLDRQQSPVASEVSRILRSRHRAMLDAKECLSTLDMLEMHASAADAAFANWQRRSRPASMDSVPETVISPDGDAILEFGSPAQFKFRVSSQVLSERSQFFKSAFKYRRVNQRGQNDSNSVNNELNSSVTEFIQASATSPMVLRLQMDKQITFKAVSTLFYAAHHIPRKVPRTISFQEFVDIAFVCHKYQCTAPVETYVEFCWLEQWVDRLGATGFEDFFFISYVFRLDSFFEMTSRMAIMRLQSSHDELLQDSKLPQEVWLRLRQAKQVILKKIVRLCRKTLDSYLRSGHLSSNIAPTPLSFENFDMSMSNSLELTRQSKCPQGSHQCDAANLGWLILVLNEVGILPAVLQVGVLPAGLSLPTRMEHPFWQTVSLEDLFRKLCTAPSAVGVHGADCDYAPAFRDSMCDLYNSIKGLSVRDVNDRYRVQSTWSVNHSNGMTDIETGQGRQEAYAMLTGSQHNIQTVETSNSNFAVAGNLPNRLSQQSNQASESSSSAWTNADGETVLTVNSDDGLSHTLTRQLSQAPEPETQSVLSSEIEVRTDRCDSLASTAPSAVARFDHLPVRNIINSTTLIQVSGRHDNSGVDSGRTEGEAETGSEDETSRRRESAKFLLVERAQKEVLTPADKELVASRRHVSDDGVQKADSPRTPMTRHYSDMTLQRQFSVPMERSQTDLGNMNPAATSSNT